ncbi:MAG TPA: CsgG/HfaB family protein [bacterium]|nr:CsgG/HfaB family protein [bacterium]
MKRGVIACLLAVALCATTQGFAQDTRKVVAVVDFEDLVHGWSSTSEVVTDRLISRLRDEAGLRVLPREQVEAALRSANVESQGVLDAGDAQKVGQSLGANYVVMGQIDQFDWEYHSAYVLLATVVQQSATVSLKGKLLDVTSGQVLGQPQGKGQLTQTGGTTWVGPWWSSISVDNFDNQLIGKATKQSVEDFAKQAVPLMK